MGAVRRCLGCSATYTADEHACPECGSHAADVEDQAEVEPEAPAAEAKPKAKPARRRKT
jgi:Zn finger protein HypA/HybF involved in hydrogenase expression